MKGSLFTVGEANGGREPPGLGKLWDELVPFFVLGDVERLVSFLWELGVKKRKDFCITKTF